VLAADRTVTFAAWKPGLLFPPGRDLAGRVEVADIGLAVGGAAAQLLERSDVVERWPTRGAAAHKWHAALRVVAGSRTMPGAAALVAAGAVQQPLPAIGWADEALRSFDRFHAAVIGPGLGRADEMAASARHTVVHAPVPLVVDGDGLFALAWNADGAATLLRRRSAPTVLTPHDGEYQLLTGARPVADRIVAARRLAFDTGCVVLLKGPTTVVADPSGQAIVVTAGDERLATAGSGDVLAGIVGALLARQVPAFDAAAMGAWVHGTAARRCAGEGFIASDLPAALPGLLAELGGAGG
jgi:NAD(P)H-hydrate epimerase